MHELMHTFKMRWDREGGNDEHGHTAYLYLVPSKVGTWYNIVSQNLTKYQVPTLLYYA